MRLLRAELNRVRMRRITWLTALALLLALAGLSLIGWQLMQPPTSEQVAEGERYYQESLGYWEESREQIIAECVEFEGLSEEECAAQYELGRPTPDMYVPTPADFSQAAGIALTASSYLLGFGALLVAASSIGAETSTGALGSWLTFVPRRVPVYLAKLVAVVLWVLVAAAALQALLVTAHLLLARAVGAAVVGPQDVWATAARSLLVVLALTVVGFTVACLGRHTIAALGAVLGYGFLAVVRLALGGYGWVQQLTPWLPEANLEAVLRDGYDYYVTEQRTTAEGIEYVYHEAHLGLAHGLAYWAVLLAVLVGVSLLVFRRRDVT
ncbi:ABC transporter permease subunit [Auraticoccus sp. F435]|uniref:ABC transporter permease subunit n=1 Tax=Auraticoccus cholistanensis TaxID=2656650 RepID=A0A6A9UUH9_9ACTN|nr:ABC transporter permease subunit [Auraticoccus cholistanensis]MVA75395.1 ABC transporter permease subunit [Auraticoccus cholistanensis]